MNRTLSLILTFLLCFSMIGISVVADDSSADNDPFAGAQPGQLYHIDFKKLYADAGYTETQDLKANGEQLEHLGIIAYGDDSSVVLTDKGLQAGMKNDSRAGLTLNTPKQGSFTIEMDISMHNFNNDVSVATNMRYVMEYGFSFQAPNGWAENSYVNMVWNKNKTITNNHSTNRLPANGDITLWDHMVGAEDYQNKTCHYTFNIDDGYLKSWSISCDDCTVTFTLNNYDRTACRASSGMFALRIRNFSDYTGIQSGDTQYINVENIKVTMLDAGTPIEEWDNILTPNRPVPTEQEFSYEDTQNTKYIPGYVLHYMDFSKITSWEDTGYFVTNDAEPEGFEIKNGLLRVNASQKMNILLTGNSIPKNMKNYTYTVKFRFATSSSRYIGLIQTAGLDQTGKATNNVGSLIRLTGIMDGASFTSKYTAEHAAQLEDMVAGEWITATVSARDGIAFNVTIECGGHIVNWIKTSGTDTLNDSYLGLRISDGTRVEIATIQVIAGFYEDYETLIWPAEEGALVQTVTEDAIQKKAVNDDQGNENTGNNDTGNNNTTDTEDNTTTEAVPTTNAPNTTAPEGGCKSATPAFATVGALALMLFPFALKKRKDD